MAKKTNIYESNLKLIAEHYQNGRTEQAMQLIEEELSMPYTPAEYLASFQRWKAQIVAEQKMAQSARTRSKEELLDLLLSHNTAEVLEAITTLQSYVLKGEDLDFVARFLASPKPPRVFRALMSQALIDQKVERSFVYGGDSPMTLVPSLVVPLRSNPIFIATVKRLAERFAKDPSALEFANQYCVFYFMYVFPQELLIRPEDLAERIFAYTMGALTNEPVSGEPVADTINKAIGQNGEPTF